MNTTPAMSPASAPANAPTNALESGPGSEPASEPGSARVTLRVLAGARSVAQHDWDALARRGYHRHRWFLACEEPDGDAHHIGLERDGKLAAIIPARVESASLHGDLHARWFGPLGGITHALGARLRPTLSIGAPMSTVSDALGDPAVLDDAALAAVFDALEHVACGARVKAIVWPFVDAGWTRLRAAARERGYREAFAGSTAVLDVPWATPEGYLATRSRQVRRTIRREGNWVHDERIRVAWERDLRALAPQIDALYRASYRRRNGRPPHLAGEFFQRLAAGADDGTCAQCAWRGDTLVEMAIALEASGVIDLCLSGQSAETFGGPLYRHCLAYDPVCAAIARGATQLHLGPTALLPKLLRGARLQERITLVHGCTAAARALVRAVAPVYEGRNRRKERRSLAAFGTRNAQ